MQSSQAYSQPAMQPWSSGESSGETSPNAAISQAPLPGFSAEQTSSILKLFQAVFDQPLQQPVQQPNSSPPTPPPTQPNSLAKKKRNQKTRQQYKRKQAQAQAQRVTIQEVEHSYGQEVDSVQISVEKVPSKQVVLPWDWMTTSSLHTAGIPYVGMASFNIMMKQSIMIQIAVIGMRRIGVG